MVKGSQSGQILLVVVLTMIVALTVGLSIAARVVTELKISKQNEESQRAFQAAEAGIQQTLESQQSYISPIDLNNNSSFSTSFVDDKGTVVIMNNGLDVDQSVGADLWLSDYSASSSALFANPMGGGSSVSITMFWGDTSQTSCIPGGANVAPAVEIILLKGPIASPTIQKSIYEAGGCGNTRISNAVSGSVGSFPATVNNNTITFRNSIQIKFGGDVANWPNPPWQDVSNGLLMKVIPIYNSSKIAFQSNIVFPSQGSVVESKGISGDTVRKVVYYQSNPQMPLEVFPYSLLSQ